ncbi:MAG: hypothetical protein IPG50_32000 [Myxococcales bacterium]|nr:hypothetical protein [Myxococcales bacterium]
MPTVCTLRYDRLRELWPDVDPHDVCRVLAHLDAVGGVDTKARVDEALSRPGREAASLDGTLASALNTIERAEKISVLHALDALIRAGGDPSAALVALAATLDDSRTVQAASAALHRAASRAIRSRRSAKLSRRLRLTTAPFATWSGSMHCSDGANTSIFAASALSTSSSGPSETFVALWAS